MIAAQALEHPRQIEVDFAYTRRPGLDTRHNPAMLRSG